MPDNQPFDSSMARLWSLSSMGLDMVITIGVVAAMGYGLDWWRGWWPWGTIGGIVLGCIMGMIKLIRTALREASRL